MNLLWIKMNRSLLIPSGTCSITLPFLHTQNLFSKNWALLLKHTKCWSLRDLFSLLSPVDATPFFSFYFTKHFIPSCSLLHTALFLHKITEEKKKTISQKVSCDAIRNVQERFLFFRLACLHADPKLHVSYRSSVMMVMHHLSLGEWAMLYSHNL